MRLLFEGGHYNIQGLAGGGYYSRAASDRGNTVRLFLKFNPEEVRHASRNANSAYLFCIARDGKKGTLSQHFMTHVVPPLSLIML